MTNILKFNSILNLLFDKNKILKLDKLNYEIYVNSWISILILNIDYESYEYRLKW